MRRVNIDLARGRIRVVEVNELELPSEDVAIALGHTDGGGLVCKLYGHRDRERALDRVTSAYTGTVSHTQLQLVQLSEPVGTVPLCLRHDEHLALPCLCGREARGSSSTTPNPASLS